MTGLYHAINTLNSDATVNTTGVVFKAGQEINLTQDFEVQLGNEFEAMIESCPPLTGGNNNRAAAGNKVNEKLIRSNAKSSLRIGRD